jgi:hypothetical protein
LLVAAAATAAWADPLTVRVTMTAPNKGAMRIVNTTTASVDLDYYEVLNMWALLNSTLWSSRDDHEGNDPPGVGWEEVDVSTTKLSETNAASFTTIEPGYTLSLGRPFNVIDWAPDLEFWYSVAGTPDLTRGHVQFISSGVGGDFDGDTDVDSMDVLQWHDDLGVGGGSDANNDMKSDGLDFLVWQRNMGTAASIASAVPEAGAGALFALAGLGVWRLCRRQGQK